MLCACSGMFNRRGISWQEPSPTTHLPAPAVAVAQGAHDGVHEGPTVQQPEVVHHLEGRCKIQPTLPVFVFVWKRGEEWWPCSFSVRPVAPH